MCVIYVCCNKVKSDARLLFEATIFDITSKDPASTYLILIKYHYGEDLHVLHVWFKPQFCQGVPII